MECSGINPTDTQNDFPSHVRHALHNLWSHHKCHHMLHLQCPLPLKYGCDLPASVHLLPESRLLPEKQGRFLLYMHFFRQPPAVSLVLQKLHSYRWYNKCLCCFFHFFRVLCCGIPAQVHLLPLFSPHFWRYSYDSLRQVPRLLLLLQVQLLQVQCFSFPWFITPFIDPLFRRLRNSS